MIVTRFTPMFIGLLMAAGSAYTQKNADCATAVDVCKKEPVKINRATGEGADRMEADFVSCFMNGDNFGMAEENSTWFKWEVAEGGTFTFVITPDNKTNDIDFVVYRLPADGSCIGKQIVRCMAAGDPPELYGKSPCLGKTGLRDGETDTSEDAGCSDEGDNTWLAPLKTVKGERYALLVSNVSEPGAGFSISFSGSAKLPCEVEEPAVARAEPKPKVKETPPPPPPPVTKPTEIGGRKVAIGETVRVGNRKLKMKIWDSQVEDGDVVSVYINDTKVLDRHLLTLRPREFEFELPAGREHYITVYADDFGKAEPNTATVEIFDGQKTYTIDLVSTRSEQESLKLVLE
ncbi:MAG: hypothetical protein SFV52_08625 [Saprospiraceae bacterium]|nr:hypothetical protein [Saprospiraceae bacterium]